MNKPTFFEYQGKLINVAFVVEVKKLPGSTSQDWSLIIRCSTGEPIKFAGMDEAGVNAAYDSFKQLIK